MAAGDNSVPVAAVIGRSRRGRPIFACRVGDGPVRVSLVGGCHADEPVGPRFLARLVRRLAGPDGAELRRVATWSVIPHVNPDGAEANAAWQLAGAPQYDIAAYLRHRVRELPGDDIEFGFPRGEDDPGARPENRAAWEFWRAGAPYDLHVSMHGMGFAAGPYFLVERGWWPRFGEAAASLKREVEGAGYELHDVERHGEKGFHRLARGFCSRPDSRAMRRHFLELGDEATAARFRPSSMEAVRALSRVRRGDGGARLSATHAESTSATPPESLLATPPESLSATPAASRSSPHAGSPRGTLTLVTEMPLFITPGVGVELGPPDPELARWRERIADWEARLRAAAGRGGPNAEGEASCVQACAREEAEVREAAAAAGLRPMPVRDQMRFQWAFIRAGLEVVARGLS